MTFTTLEAACREARKSLGNMIHVQSQLERVWPSDAVPGEEALILTSQFRKGIDHPVVLECDVLGRTPQRVRTTAGLFGHVYRLPTGREARVRARMLQGLYDRGEVASDLEPDSDAVQELLERALSRTQFKRECVDADLIGSAFPYAF